jgi:N-acetylglucosamine-6-phosphate deacetylase
MKALDAGSIEAGKTADLTVLNRDLRVVQTYLGGKPVLESGT